MTRWTESAGKTARYPRHQSDASYHWLLKHQSVTICHGFIFLLFQTEKLLGIRDVGFILLSVFRRYQLQLVTIYNQLVSFLQQSEFLNLPVIICAVVIWLISQHAANIHSSTPQVEKIALRWLDKPPRLLRQAHQPKAISPTPPEYTPTPQSSPSSPPAPSAWYCSS